LSFSEVNISLSEPNLRLSHLMGANPNEVSASYSAENARWRAAGHHLLRRIGEDVSHWEFAAAKTHVLANGTKSVQYTFARRSTSATGPHSE